MDNDSLLFALFMGAIITVLVIWLRDGSVDRPAGVMPRGNRLPTSPFDPTFDAPQPDLLATQCGKCRAIRCNDLCWHPESIVPLPVNCRVRRDCCPSCERRAHIELEAAVTSRHVTA